MEKAFASHVHVRPRYVEVTINDRNGNKEGQLKVKPTTILWKPGAKGQLYYYSISLDEFTKWIKDNGELVSR